MKGRVSYMNLVHKIKTVWREWHIQTFIRNIVFLGRNHLAYTFLDTKDEVLERCAFELDELRDMLLPLVPSVMSVSDSLVMLRDNPKSFARYGDGEIDIMLGLDHSFQKYDPVLAEKLLALLKTKRDDIYVGINDYFHAASPYLTKISSEFFRRNVTRFRRFFLKSTNPEIQYLHASCLLGLFNKKFSGSYGEIIAARKRLFEGRKLAVVAGKNVLSKLKYDIFDMAADKIMIEAPSMNAFSEYDSIIRNIKSRVSREYLVCLILGQTATAMVGDLTDMGYMAWDVGHIAKDYDAYMKNLKEGRELDDIQLDFFAPD